MMYDQTSTGAGANQIPTDRLWGAALTLILVIAIINIGARVVVSNLRSQEVVDRKLRGKAVRPQRRQHLLRGFPSRFGCNVVDLPRSVTAFIGSSGCGKTTVLRILNRMHEVVPGARVEGTVLLDDENIYAPGIDPVGVRRAVGMVFQRPVLFPAMSIRDNVVAGLKVAGRAQSQDAR